MERKAWPSKMYKKQNGLAMNRKNLAKFMPLKSNDLSDSSVTLGAKKKG
jgi:hypothetical protein